MCPYEDNTQTVFSGYIKSIITEIITLSISLLWDQFAKLQTYTNLVVVVLSGINSD